MFRLPVSNAPAARQFVFLRKQEPRATGVAPVILGSCLHRSTAPGQAVPPFATIPKKRRDQR